MKMRSDCVLNALTPDQRNELFDSIASGVSYRDVQKRCAQPSPDGFGLCVHLNTLGRFYKLERRRRHSEELAQAKFEDLLSDHPETLLQNVKVELAHACFDLAHHPDTPNVNVLARITHRLDLLRVEQQRLALERDFLAEKKRQFNFDAAKQAAIHALQIKEILADQTIDTPAKIWKVSDLVFGPPSEKESNS